MARNTDSSSAAATLRALRVFARDFIAFAGSRFTVAAAFVAAGAVFESIGLVLLVPLLSLVTRTGPGNSTLQHAVDGTFGVLGVSAPMPRLAVLLAAFVLLMILRGVIMLQRDYLILTLQSEFIEDLRARIMGALAAAGWEHVLRLRHARIVHIVSGDIQRISTSAHFLLQSGISVVILAFQCALAFWLAPRLALLAFALLAVGTLALIPILRRARAMGTFVTGANLALLDATGQFLNGLKLAISQSLQASFASEFQETLAALRIRQMSYYREQVGGRVALASLSALVGAVAVLVGYGMLGIGAPVLIAFLLIVARMSGPATQIQQGFQQIAFGLPPYEQALTLLSELKPETATSSPSDAKLDGAIALDQVVYRHVADAGERTVHGVNGVSLRIEPGSFVGIDGTSGAGKTTLIDVLVGLLRPQSGRIVVGDVELTEELIPAWRAQLSYITQDSFLFHESIRRNLLWANPHATEDEMWQALALAGVDGVVRRMTHGLDTMVGERGSLVSGGERQRIALARALLRKPRLLVMDEATNAIDVATETAILTRLRAILPPITMVMIAHRPESLAVCDRILHVEAGRLTDA